VANIYYSSAGNHLGVLRAVLSSEEGRCLLGEHAARYVGQQFPAAGHDSEVDFAVLRIFEGEQNKEYCPGFYVFGDNLIRIEDAVKSCDTSSAARV
jgi:hypothetical protein